MAKRLVVFPYKMGSKSGKLLASVLGCQRVFADGDYKPQPNDVIINWGSGYRPNWAPLVRAGQLINHWKDVAHGVDKAATFRLFDDAGVKMPDVTTSQRKAKAWLEDEDWVVGRQTLEGRDGEGIVLMKNESEFVNCQLYTKYIKKVTEFRVYVMNGEVIDCLEKRRDTEMLAAGKVDPNIRTERNGWCFCRQGVVTPAKVGKQAVKACNAVGLVFAGVDVIWNPQHEQAYVLEVNSAPSIFGPTVHKYAAAFKTYAETL